MFISYFCLYVQDAIILCRFDIIDLDTDRDQIRINLRAPKSLTRNCDVTDTQRDIA